MFADSFYMNDKYLSYSAEVNWIIIIQTKFRMQKVKYIRMCKFWMQRELCCMKNIYVQAFVLTRGTLLVKQ
jgi:hypothetical protein